MDVNEVVCGADLGMHLSDNVLGASKACIQGQAHISPRLFEAALFEPTGWQLL